MMPMLSARMNTIGPKERRASTVRRVGFCNRAENLGLGEVACTGEQDVERVGLLKEWSSQMMATKATAAPVREPRTSSHGLSRNPVVT